jgi:hypothetical protein
MFSTCIFSSCRGLIVPSKEKKKEKSRSRLIKKLGRKSESVSQSQSSSGLVSLLEMMRGQMEVTPSLFLSYCYFFISVVEAYMVCQSMELHIYYSIFSCKVVLM